MTNTELLIAFNLLLGIGSSCAFVHSVETQNKLALYGWLIVTLLTIQRLYNVWF